MIGVGRSVCAARQVVSWGRSFPALRGRCRWCSGAWPGTPLRDEGARRGEPEDTLVHSRRTPCRGRARAGRRAPWSSTEQGRARSSTARRYYCSVPVLGRAQWVVVDTHDPSVATPVFPVLARSPRTLASLHRVRSNMTPVGAASTTRKACSCSESPARSIWRVEVDASRRANGGLPSVAARVIGLPPRRRVGRKGRLLGPRRLGRYAYWSPVPLPGRTRPTTSDSPARPVRPREHDAGGVEHGPRATRSR